MSGFSIDWLDLREDADRRARDSDLCERAVHWLQLAPSRGREAIVVDLGAGTGSTLRALDGAGQRPLLWRLLDHDPALLAEARRRHGGQTGIETFAADLSDIGTLPLDGARLVTASALFDLVSAEFLQALAQVLQRPAGQDPIGVYSALNYDGLTQWTPSHPLDDVVLEAFNCDQRRDKGFGPALGPEAAGAMCDAFSQAGFRVFSASSPWVLDGADEPLVSALITGIAAAVAGSPGVAVSSLEDWVRFRQAQVTSGSCTVGHTDLLAVPDPASAHATV
ncbi:class I SAM-dependent methyltransferase [Chromatocurvus halotolerans]|uniref:Methyltransferase family protein n=1 Tax=Chromatocurvus halotolerans TaxID=1132028 RepID=A0A4R2L8P6_9GAMM|nr:class I SAM-dependent methyltransferase [Chromatocurvus halotolerans]TCO75595.1 hypothetical protein EV688_10712 [Chromatocurvus halotolerans]